MSLGQWLALTDYSAKYKVSVSTLRRRIKTEDINFQLKDGKYFLIDEPMSAHQKHRPSQDSEVEMMGAHLAIPTKLGKDEPILTAANKLLNELKKAYSQILCEKEEQIMRLKEEIADLKTLVKVLESENSRINSRNSN